jgi:hypothetical protein
MNKACGPRTRVILTYFNYLWAPVLRVGERLGTKRPQPDQNWLALPDLQNLLSLAGFQTISKGYKILLPVRIPLLSSLCNRALANLPLIPEAVPGRDHYRAAGPRLSPGRVALVHGGDPRPQRKGKHRGCGAADPGDGASHGNPLRRGEHSGDGTAEEIERVIAAHPGRDVKLIRQGSGVGKGDAVRKGFAAGGGRRSDDPRRGPDRATRGTAEIPQGPRVGSRRVRPRLPPRLPDEEAGDTLPEHAGEQVLQPRVHMPARPALRRRSSR